MIAYKITTPAFLVDLVIAAFKGLALSNLFKVSPQSKAHWDLEHQIQMATDHEELRRLEWALKALDEEGHKK